MTAAKGRRTRLSNADLLALVMDGVPHTEIAAAHGITPDRVRQRLNDMGYRYDGTPLQFTPKLEPLPDVGDLPEFDAVLCAETDPELFHPENGVSDRPAKDVCGRCDARTQCLEWALDHPTEVGIWGGTSHRERLVLLKKRAQGGVDDAA